MVTFRGSWGGLTSRDTDKGSAGLVGLVDCMFFCSILRLPLIVAVFLERFLDMSW